MTKAVAKVPEGIPCPRCGGTGRLSIEAVTVGDMILQARQISGLTQAELAVKVQLSRGQVANIEGGRTDLPTRTLGRFASALGCSMKDLVP